MTEPEEDAIPKSHIIKVNKEIAAIKKANPGIGVTEILLLIKTKPPKQPGFYMQETINGCFKRNGWWW